MDINDIIPADVTVQKYANAILAYILNFMIFPAHYPMILSMLSTNGVLHTE